MFIKETVKGMRDILPAEMEIREYLLNKLKYIYTSFGFTQIETPCMERIENLTNKQGGENEKLIFKVLKRGEKLNFHCFHEPILTKIVPRFNRFSVWVEYPHFSGAFFKSEARVNAGRVRGTRKDVTLRWDIARLFPSSKGYATITM